MSSRLVISSHHPGRQRLRWLLLLVLCLLFSWGTFLLGEYAADSGIADLRDEQTVQADKVSKLIAENQGLRERLAVLQRSAQIDQQAYGEIERSLKQAQDEMLELKEEVAFYRSIVSPAETASGLSVTRFQVSNMGRPDVYRFKLVLTQLRTNNRVVKGYATLDFEGVKGGKQIRLGLKEVSAGMQGKLKLRFKYFQNIEGDIVFPKGFLPTRVTLQVVPSGKKLKRFKKSFDWSDIIH